MSDESPATTDQLIEGILKGQVPRQVRLFAAQGLLPVSRNELLRLQVILSADPDPELAKVAAASLKGESEEMVVEWAKGDQAETLELDLLIRVRREESVWGTVAAHPNVSDDTLRKLAQHGPPLVQDIIITNHVRILGCLEILEDVRSNPQATQVILRRVREFEEEFIEKAIAAGGDVPVVGDGPDLSEAFAALKAIGAHIPGEDELGITEFEDTGVHETVKKAGVSAFARLLDMSIKEKVIVAIKGSREERGILINSRNRLVIRGVLGSPKLSDLEIERFANSRSVSDEVIRIIASNKKWLRRYGVINALTQNPKAPIQATLRMLPRLNHRDLARLARNRNANPVVRRQAHYMSEQRK